MNAFGAHQLLKQAFWLLKKSKPLWRSVISSLYLGTTQHSCVCQHFIQVVASLCCAWFGHSCLRASLRPLTHLFAQMKMIVRHWRSCARNQHMSNMTNPAFGLLRLDGIDSVLCSQLAVLSPFPIPILHKYFPVCGAEKLIISEWFLLYHLWS